MIDIERINELSRKSRTAEGLTPQEKQEQATLRKAYIDAVKQSLTAQLENTYIVDECGTKTKVKQKDKQ